MILSDLIVSNTGIVSDFKTRDEKAQKSSEQHNIDVNFANAIGGVRQTVVHLCEIKKGAGFEETKDANKKVLELLNTCKEAIEQKHVKASDTAKVNGLNRELNDMLTVEWKEYHAHKTSSIKEILSIARTLSGNEATSLINDINAASGWDSSTKSIIRMTDAITEADELIGRLELNDSIVEFLKKMIDHKASLEDLSSEVLDWVKKEDLEKRVKLSFG